jgi:hypothetical protein
MHACQVVLHLFVNEIREISRLGLEIQLEGHLIRGSSTATRRTVRIKRVRSLLLKLTRAMRFERRGFREGVVY